MIVLLSHSNKQPREIAFTGVLGTAPQDVQWELAKGMIAPTLPKGRLEWRDENGLLKAAFVWGRNNKEARQGSLQKAPRRGNRRYR